MSHSGRHAQLCSLQRPLYAPGGWGVGAGLLGSSSWCCQPTACLVLSNLWPWDRLPFSQNQLVLLDVSFLT